MSLNDINLGQITEALNGKIDLPENKSQSDVKVIVETYVNGTSWYRVWSDGWCEQGGVIGGAISSATFLKPFLSTDYTLNVFASTSSTGNTRHSICTSKTVSGFTVYIGEYAAAGVTNSSYSHNWQASGYIGEQS